MDNQLLKQSIRLTGVDNARELGGYISADGRTVRDGVLLRTYHGNRKCQTFNYDWNNCSFKE